MSGSTSPVTAIEDYGAGKAGIAARWITELDLAEKEFHDWVFRAKAIEKRYRDDRTTIQDSIRRGSGTYRFNVLWSNVQTLMPAVYARPPKPVVQRRFRDRDPVGRAASQIIERALDYQIECGDLHATVKQAVEDYLLGGRGTVWLRYEPKYATPQTSPEITDADDDGPEAEETGEDGSMAEGMEAEGGEPMDGTAENAQVTDGDQGAPDYEEVECDYVYWEDFTCSPARIWKEVRWVARRVFMTRGEMRARFDNLSEIDIMAIPLDWKPNHMTDESIGVEHQAFMRATIWEIWNRDDRRVYWIAPGYGAQPLDMRDDPLGLEQFFPCPRPLTATTTNGTIVPVPDYTEYQDQADQLDDLTGRIAMVTKAVKVAGLYAAEEREIARLFSEGVENQLLPVNNWAGFMENGGLERAVMLMPMEKIASVLRDLTEIRTVVKNDLYEITGIADVIRGSTQPEETATAQRIKGKYATMRLSDKQVEVARFVRDILRMMGEIMCDHFSPQSLLMMSDYMQSNDSGMAEAQDKMMEIQGMMAMGQQPDPQQVQQVQAQMRAAQMEAQKAQKKIADAVMLLKNETARGFRIDIEDQSTIAVDDQEEQAARTGFVTAVSSFLKEAVPAVQQVPEMGELLGKMLLFAVRGYRVGRDMETTIEDALAQLQKAQAAAASQPKPPSPDEIKAQAEQQKMQADMQMSQQQAEAEGMKYQAELAIKQMEMQAKDAADQRAHEFAMAELELKARQQQADEKKLLIEARKMDAEAIDAENKAALSTGEKNKMDNEEAQTAEMATRLDNVEGAVMEVAKTVNEGHAAVVQHLRQIGGAKRIIRGPDGRAVGVEPVPVN